MSPTVSFLVICAAAFGFVGMLTRFFSSRRKLFVRLFVPSDDLRETVRTWRDDGEFQCSVRAMAGLQFLVSAGFGIAAFVTRLLVATLLILALMPGAPCLADDGVRKATIAFLRSHPITIDTSDGAIEWLRIWGSYGTLARAPTPEFDLRSLPKLRDLEVGDHHAVDTEFRHYGELSAASIRLLSLLHFHDRKMEAYATRRVS